MRFQWEEAEKIAIRTKYCMKYNFTAYKIWKSVMPLVTLLLHFPAPQHNINTTLQIKSYISTAVNNADKKDTCFKYATAHTKC
jgi:hypothetical protein